MKNRPCVEAGAVLSCQQLPPVKYNPVDFSCGARYTVSVEEYITPKQAAERKGVSLAAIYRAIERGALPSTEVLGRKGLRPADVASYQPGSYGGVERSRRRRGPLKKDKQATRLISPTGAGDFRDGQGF